jgi:hypothetical protein
VAAISGVNQQRLALAAESSGNISAGVMKIWQLIMA